MSKIPEDELRAIWPDDWNSVDYIKSQDSAQDMTHDRLNTHILRTYLYGSLSVNPKRLYELALFPERIQSLVRLYRKYYENTNP